MHFLRSCLTNESRIIQDDMAQNCHDNYGFTSEILISIDYHLKPCKQYKDAFFSLQIPS